MPGLMTVYFTKDLILSIVQKHIVRLFGLLDKEKYCIKGPFTFVPPIKIYHSFATTRTKQKYQEVLSLYYGATKLYSIYSVGAGDVPIG